MLTGATFTSCSDFLDGAEQNRSEIDDSKITAEQRRNQAYFQLRSIYNGSGILGMFVKGTDIYINQSGDTSGETFDSYTLTPSNEDEVKNFYAYNYEAINNANAAIDYSNSQVDCDARFIRALCYYNLVQQFGAVPLIKQTITTSERNYPRTDISEIYSYISEDLANVVENGDIANTDKEGYCSKAAAAALLSKIYLAAGWDTGVTLNDQTTGSYTVNSTEYFTKAANFAQKSIDFAGGRSALAPTYEQKWLPSNDGKLDEVLFAIQYSRSVSKDQGTELSGGHQLGMGFSGYYGAATNGYKLMNHLNNPNKKMLHLYTAGDQRFDATFMTTVYENNYAAYYSGGTNSIAYRFLPPYATYDDIKADFTKNGAKYKNCTATTGAAIIRVGDKIAYYFCKPSTTEVPAEASLKSLDYYAAGTDGSTSTGSYSGWLKTSTDFNTYSGLICKKWDDPLIDQSSNRNQNYRNVVLLSLSDIYLVLAEAKLMSGAAESEWLAPLNIVRQRAGLQDINSVASYSPTYAHSFSIRPIDIVLDERALELFAEPSRWEDLRRTKQLVLYYNEFNNNASKSALVNSKGTKWYRPIPANEISSNTAISEADQNPGY